MKTLILSIDPIYPACSGGDLRNAANVEAALALGPVVAASLYAGAGPVPEGVRAVALGRRSAGDSWQASLQFPKLALRVTEEEKGALRELLRDERPDVVLLEGLRLLEALQTLGQCTDACVVLDMHNVESRLQTQMDLAGKSRLGRLLGGRAARENQRRYEEVERRALAGADAVWVCSKEDAETLSQIHGPQRLEIVPNAIPSGRLLPPRGKPPAANAPVIAYIGHLAYEPNVHAVEVLAADVFPRVRRSCPRARLIVAGRSPGRPMGRLLGGAAGVELIPDPKDIGPILAQADFTVIALREGGGTRIKVLEALAAGVVVVATPTAVEGLGLVDGVHAVIAARPSAMAEAVRKLTKDGGAYLSVSRAGRRFVENRYGPTDPLIRTRNFLKACAEGDRDR